MPIRFSVQICSYNRWHLLKRSLEALFAQDFPNDEYEIVFVDDGSTDSSLAMAEELAKNAPCRLKVLTKPNDGLSRARNLGIRNCEGEIILFMDDDTFADPALLKEHLVVHEQHPNAVVMGWVNHIEELDPSGPRKYVMLTIHDLSSGPAMFRSAKSILTKSAASMKIFASMAGKTWSWAIG